MAQLWPIGQETRSAWGTQWGEQAIKLRATLGGRVATNGWRCSGERASRTAQHGRQAQQPRSRRRRAQRGGDDVSLAIAMTTVAPGVIEISARGVLNVDTAYQLRDAIVTTLTGSRLT